MALSLSNFLYICSVINLVSLVSAELRIYNLSVGWVTRNPDGLFDRPVIGINGQWPIPRIEATVGDRVVVNLNNQLGNESTSLHFHGLFMNGTNEMDGVVGVTQCGIPPGSSFTYNFTVWQSPFANVLAAAEQNLKVDQPGTYWYHSHIDGQYPDGLRGPFIVHDPDSPYAGQYDEELVLTLSDWYHEEMPGLIKKFISVTNPTGAEPVPQSALMNDTQNLQINIQPNKTYFIRLINMAAFAAQYFWIEDHPFHIVEVDGVWTEPAETNMIYITPAQRYGLLLTTKNQTEFNYAIHGAMDTELFDKVPKTLNPNVTSYLIYDPDEPLPIPSYNEPLDPFDDFELVPVDGQELFDDPGQIVLLNMNMGNLGDGANYAFINDITYVRPQVPSLYTALTTDEFASNSIVYGLYTNAFVLGYNEVTEIVLNNHDAGKHPFHLHGHNFQAVVRGNAEDGDYQPQNFLESEGDDDGGYGPHNVTMPAVPMRRDTFLVHPNSHIVLRFRSDNPGVWLFHCHIEWHVDSGLIATIVEAPLELQGATTIPSDHYAACAASHPPTPTVGNAAARTDDLLNVDGQNQPPPPLPAGFTTRGIIALVFSIVAAFAGMVSVVWYGMGELSVLELEDAKKRIAQAGDGILEDADNTAAITAPVVER